MHADRTPSLRRHKPSGQAVVILNGTDHYLGQRKAPPAVREAYDRLIAEWLANGRRLPSVAGGAAPTVAELIALFWKHVETYYRREDGTQTSEVYEYKGALRTVNHLYGSLPAAEFSPLKLKAVRQLMLDGYTHPKYGPQIALSRGVINQRVRRIVCMFKWAVAKELVAADVHQALKSVSGIQRGRTEARETDSVKPVPDAIVDATLPHVLPPVRAMIRVQRLAGMRPGEVCVMRGCDIDITGDVWLFRPHHHKTKHRSKERVVAIGPKGQAVIKPFLKLDVQAYLFDPREGLAEKRTAMRQARKSPVQPSQQNRRKRKPRRCVVSRDATAHIFPPGR